MRTHTPCRNVPQRARRGPAESRPASIRPTSSASAGLYCSSKSNPGAWMRSASDTSFAGRDIAQASRVAGPSVATIRVRRTDPCSQTGGPQRKGEGMRQVWISRKGGPEVLEVREAPDPQSGPGEVRIRVKAAGVNFADLMARVGLYRDAPPIPCVMGYEVAGEIDLPAERAGERVIAGTRFGGGGQIV